MRIDKLNKDRLIEYEYLAERYGTIFNTINWLKMFDDAVSIYGIYDNGDNMIGGFHLYRHKMWGFSICRDAPFTPTSGPFLKLESKNPVAIMNKWKKVLTLMADLIECLKYQVVSISLDKSVLDTQPFIWNKYKVVPRYTYILDLHKPLDEIRCSMSSKQRNHINKAIKDGLIVRRVTKYGIIKSFVTKTFTRHNMNVNEYYLDKLLFEFGNIKNSFAFATYKEDTPNSVIFCIHDNKTAYNLLSGYDVDSKHHGGGALAFWEAIKYAKTLNLNYFDFEGSEIPRIEKYFRGFGGRLVPYYRINKAKLSLEILLKFFKRELF